MPTRRIFFERLALDAKIGILAHERSATQPLHIDAEFDVDAGLPDDHDLKTVLDYRLLHHCMVDECTRTHVNLLETLVVRVQDRIFRQFPQIQRMRLRITKPLAFSDCQAVGIESERSRDP